MHHHFLPNTILSRVLPWALIILATAVYGQGGNAPMYFDHLTIQDGLSHNTVYCILQDRYGYIWMGTQNGLNKYDGYSFEVYGSNGYQNDKAGFLGKNISALREDRKGNLWVGTRKHGVNFLDRSSDRFVNFQSDPAFETIKGYEISSFWEDKDGNIWITTVGGGVMKYSPSAGVSQVFTTENSGLSSNVAFDIVEDKYGLIWVAAAGGGLNYLQKNGRFALSHQMLPDNPNMSGYRKKMLLDDAYLWIGTEGTGLYKMNLKDRSYIHFAPASGQRAISSDVVRDLYKTKYGKLFIATDGGGLNIYDTATEEMSVYTYQVEEETALNSNALFCFWGDRTGNIWIGTYNGGINIFKPNKAWFEFFAPASARSDELEHRSILSVFQSREGKIWIGTDGGGLNWFDQENSRFSAPSFKHDPSNPASLAGNVVKTIFEDSQNRLWIGLFGAGLEVYDLQSNSFRHFLGGTTSVWSIAEGNDGKLWIATMGDGLSVIDPQTRQTTVFQHNPADSNSLADFNVMAVFVDRENQVWVGTASNGLDRWDEATGRFLHYRHNHRDSFSLSNDEIRAIYQDSRGQIWIGTEGGGLNRWLGEGRFERTGKEEGLIANSVMGITEDKDGMIWASTFQGISRLGPSTNAIRNFDFRAMQSFNQFNQMAILTADNGKLFFGGINGLNTIQPDLVKEKNHQAGIIFTGIKIFNNSISAGKLPDGRIVLDRSIEEAERVHLSYLDKSFSIEFSATDYTSPSENKFTYKLEGFDEDWRLTPAGQHSASYTNLDPGTYTFRVRHLDKEASITVFIKPPFWQTLWFRFLLLISIIGLISSGVLFLIKRREAVHKRQILQLRNEKLATEVEAKNSKLMFSAVQMAHKNEILADVKNDLQELKQEPEANLRALVRKLERELMSEDYWEEFNVYFNQVDQHFIQSILEKHPELTQNDLRLCSLLRINLSTKEIASLLNISSRGVEQSRYRLKKRLGLGTEDDLSRYITMFNSEGQ
ncbi:MAG: two component regulator propeller domain protein [Lewinellaceae bacterium]|nr:two component regulator propeller domain protein [Lewinellaceae bacterium]